MKLIEISDQLKALLNSFHLGPIPRFLLNSYWYGIEKKRDISKLKWEGGNYGKEKKANYLLVSVLHPSND